MRSHARRRWAIVPAPQFQTCAEEGNSSTCGLQLARSSRSQLPKLVRNFRFPFGEQPNKRGRGETNGRGRRDWHWCLPGSVQISNSKNRLNLAEFSFFTLPLPPFFQEFCNWLEQKSRAEHTRSLPGFASRTLKKYWIYGTKREGERNGAFQC